MATVYIKCDRLDGEVKQDVGDDIAFLSLNTNLMTEDLRLEIADCRFSRSQSHERMGVSAD